MDNYLKKLEGIKLVYDSVFPTRCPMRFSRRFHDHHTYISDVSVVTGRLDHIHFKNNTVRRCSWNIGTRCEGITFIIHISFVRTIGHVSRVHMTHTYMVPEQGGNPYSGLY